MSQPQDNSQYVRRVVLPSGRAIEVVYFDNVTPLPERASVIDAAVVDLHVCPMCDLGLVYPTDWDEASSTHWEVALRCPNCEWSAVGLYEQAVVDRFDEQLDLGMEALVEDLHRLVQANMEAEIERFSQALGGDAIWPMDF